MAVGAHDVSDGAAKEALFALAGVAATSALPVDRLPLVVRHMCEAIACPPRDAASSAERRWPAAAALLTSILDGTGGATFQNEVKRGNVGGSRGVVDGIIA